MVLKSEAGERPLILFLFLFNELQSPGSRIPPDAGVQDISAQKAKNPYDVRAMNSCKIPARYLALSLIAAFPALFSLDLMACSKHGTNAGTDLVSIYGEADIKGFRALYFLP